VAIDKQAAVNAQEFHHVTESQGRNGAECYRVRRNGRTQVWARTPGRFRIPVKHGISARGQGQIRDSDAQQWNAVDPCTGRCERCAQPL
jgi:hypothetical protein